MTSWLVLVAGAGGWCWWLVLVLADLDLDLDLDLVLADLGQPAGVNWIWFLDQLAGGTIDQLRGRRPAAALTMK